MVVWEAAVSRTPLASLALSFPAGRTDDIADAMGLLGRLLDKMFGASIPTVEEMTAADYHGMQGFSYLDDGLEGEDTWRTL